MFARHFPYQYFICQPTKGVFLVVKHFSISISPPYFRATSQDGSYIPSMLGLTRSTYRLENLGLTSIP